MISEEKKLAIIEQLDDAVKELKEKKKIVGINFEILNNSFQFDASGIIQINVFYNGKIYIRQIITGAEMFGYLPFNFKIPRVTTILKKDNIVVYQSNLNYLKSQHSSKLFKLSEFKHCQKLYNQRIIYDPNAVLENLNKEFEEHINAVDVKQISGNNKLNNSNNHAGNIYQLSKEINTWFFKENGDNFQDRPYIKKI